MVGAIHRRRPPRLRLHVGLVCVATAGLLPAVFAQNTPTCSSENHCSAVLDGIVSSEEETSLLHLDSKLFPSHDRVALGAAAVGVAPRSSSRLPLRQWLDRRKEVPSDALAAPPRGELNLLAAEERRAWVGELAEVGPATSIATVLLEIIARSPASRSTSFESVSIFLVVVVLAVGGMVAFYMFTAANVSESGGKFLKSGNTSPGQATPGGVPGVAHGGSVGSQARAPAPKAPSAGTRRMNSSCVASPAPTTPVPESTPSVPEPTPSVLAPPPSVPAPTPSVPQGYEHVLLTPSLREAPVQPNISLPYQVINAEGQVTIFVNLRRPASSAEASEYVSLTTDDGQEMATLVFSRGPDGVTECLVYEGAEESKQLFGNLVSIVSPELGKEAFELVETGGGSAKIRVIGRVAEPQLQVFSGDNQLMAFVEPSGKTHNKVTCMPNADIALVVLAVLGIDRMQTLSRA